MRVVYFMHAVNMGVNLPCLLMAIMIYVLPLCLGTVIS